YGTRTRVTAVKGRCLNRLTKGPSIYKWRRRRDLNPRAGKFRPIPLAGAPLQPLEYFSNMAPQVGFEPTTDRLTADCSTTELLWNIWIAFCDSDNKYTTYFIGCQQVT